MDTKQLIQGQKVYKISANEIICLTIKRPFAKISDRELMVLILIRQKKSLKEIAISFNVTTERIRQIFVKALRRGKISMGVKRFQELNDDELDKIVGNNYFSTVSKLNDR